MQFTHIGIIFNKKNINDHTILNPINTARCNIIDNLTYDVEFIGEIGSIFESCFDIDDISIGFVISLEELEKKYGNLEDAIKIYQDEILSYLYIQTYDYKNDINTTYKIDLYNNKFFKVAEFKNNAINYKDEEIIFTNYDVSKISNINYILPTKEKTQEKDKNDIKINMKELYFAIKENVIGQDETIKQIVSTIDRNYNITNFRNKTNILLIGPSGSGKTEIFRTIANNINIPITIEDSEQYSAVGYKGANIEDMLIKLYNKANKNLELAERGILVVDEIDKKVSKDKDDVSGTRVLNAFLSLMEGTTFRINVGTENNPEYVNFNTEFLTVVLAGAFSDMTIKEKGLGFNNKLEMQKEYKDISLDDLNKYGLSNETLRRVSICRLNNLTLDNLIDIMLKSKNSALFEYYKYAEKKKIKLIITDEAIKEIASIAIKKNVGASGIKDTLNEILNDAIFEVEMNEGIYSSIKITKESLSTKPPYQLIKKNDK